jgi:hypothetical protein
MTFNDVRMRFGSSLPRFGFGFGPLQPLKDWFDGSRKGPAVTGEKPPQSDPGIMQRQHKCDAKLHQLTQLWSHRGGAIAGDIAETSTALDETMRDLEEADIDWNEQLDHYRRSHRGAVPTRESWFSLLGYWLLVIILGLADFPLMLAALNQLSIPDGLRYIAAAGALVLTTTLAGMVGRSFAVRGKTIGQRAFACFLAALLLAIVIVTALLRSGGIEKRGPSSEPPAVFLISEPGGKPLHV